MIMNIVMFTNDYEPVIGGVARSISTFSEDLRRLGHNVLVVTLTFPGAEVSEENVFRLPSIQEVNGTQFSIRLPVPVGLRDRLDAFSPDMIHSHHPFMVGDTALRVARKRGLPIVFTYHTLYERYAYLFSRESKALESIAETIATEYANLCDLVAAPTHSIERLIRGRGVRVPINVIPTGIDTDFYGKGRGADFRRQHGIPEDAFVLGYLGRVVEAKNMGFLTRAAARFLSQASNAWFLVVGEGESEEEVRQLMREAGVSDRLVMVGSLSGEAVADAYAAMDLFGFASRTETQGIVLIESLSAGVPILGIDAPGTRDSVEHNKSGIILDADSSAEHFASEIRRLKDDPDLLSNLARGASKRAQDFERTQCAQRLLSAYVRLKKHKPEPEGAESDIWPALQERFAAEWDLFKEKLSAVAAALNSDDD
jgi:glycosyltransferase involved in cell wall biosynthesis